MSQQRELPAKIELTLEERRNFLRLPLEERRRILRQQAEAMIGHYDSSEETRRRLEWQAGDIVEF